MSQRHYRGLLPRLFSLFRSPSLKFVSVLLALTAVGVFLYLKGRPGNNVAPYGLTQQAPLQPSLKENLQTNRSFRSESVLTPLKEGHDKSAKIDYKVATSDKPKSVSRSIPAPREKKPLDVAITTEEQRPAPPLLSAGVKLNTETILREEVRLKYYKIGSDGKNLPEDADSWACVRDPKNRLVWEVKSEDGGLHDKNGLYTWYEPEGGKAAGVADGGRCSGGIDCDSHAFVQAINAEGLCGYKDWRLPTRDEMTTLVVMGDDGTAMIDHGYFPRGLGSWYWTATSNEKHREYAWYLLFRNGMTLSDDKGRAKHLRLVRSDGQGGSY